MFDGLYFEYSLFSLLIVPFIVCDYFCKMRLPSIYFPHTQQFMKQSVSSSKSLFILKWLVVIMMILALMSPVKDEPYELDPKDGYEIVLIVDASNSMREKGFDTNNRELNRFDVVKNIVSDFIMERKNDNLGLVVFGEFSFIASPLTYDEHILERIVSQLRIGMAGKYTALYESLAQGVNLLKMSDSKTKIAILLTDGHSSPQIDNIPLDVAIDMAKKENIKVYTIGIGHRGEYNEKVLKKIANDTGAYAFGASSATQLEEIYSKIDQLEKSKIENETFSYTKYYYFYPLFLSFLSLILYVYFRNKRGS